MGLFGPSKGTAESAIKFIIEFFKDAGLDPNECQHENSKEFAAWTFARGSAPVLILVHKAPEFPYISVCSPIVKLPEADQVNALMYHCMAKNYNSPATIGLNEEAGHIVVQYGRPIEGLDKEELQGMMAVVSGVADELDNELAEK
ncbi:uncharacterized protein METZ01_LOCUS309248, partial [marine metagenome]